MSKKRKTKKSHSKGKFIPTPKRVNQQVRELFISTVGEQHSYLSVLKNLRLRDHKSKEAAKAAIFSLEASGFIRKLSNNKFVLDMEVEEIIGKVDHVNARFAYVIIPDREDDIWVKTSNLNFAIDGDEVAIQITKEASKDARAE